MKIADAGVTPIRVALKRPFCIAGGTITRTNQPPVRVTDEEGRVGWGEAITFHTMYGHDQKILQRGHQGSSDPGPVPCRGRCDHRAGNPGPGRCGGRGQSEPVSNRRMAE